MKGFTAVVIDVVVGEESDPSVPEVAAVALDFTRPALADAEGSTAGDVPYPGTVPDEPVPGRRERRRARRRPRGAGAFLLL